MNINLKDQLYQLCLNFVAQRIHTATEALQQAQEASIDDTKSSAGDKFETGREMAQQDINRNKQLLADAQQQKAVLLSLAEVKAYSVVRSGSLVITDGGNFYIAISAGQLTLAGETYFAVSAMAPIAKSFMGKGIGTKVDFNGKTYLIKEVF